MLTADKNASSVGTKAYNIKADHLTGHVYHTLFSTKWTEFSSRKYSAIRSEEDVNQEMTKIMAS